MERSEPSGTAGAGRAVTRFVRELDPRVIDVLLAVALTAAALAIIAGRSPAPDFRDDDLLGTLLVVLQTAPLAARRIAPIGVLTVIGAGLLSHSAIGYEVVDAGTFSSLVATYSAASLTDTRRSMIAGAIAAAAIVGFFATNRGSFGAQDVGAVTGTWTIAWLAGNFVRIRGDEARLAGARAARLELEQEMRAREAVADERARMARELHDIVGHALNVIVIQSAGAQRVFDAKPDIPRQSLASIESTGRAALVDMERMLGVLRAADGAREEANPQPGLAQLEALAAHVTDAGLPVDVIVEGERAALPASVDLSAYRIVQESLTNCLKHASATRATVTVRFHPDDIEVEVLDDGRGGSTNGDRLGRGQVGMRERVALFGGDISIGPRKPAGYRVWARLPFAGAPP